MENNGNSPRERYEERERKSLHPKATLSTDTRCIHRSHEYKPDDIRGEFHRDYTRIIHCRAFRRLRHKTQVFISPENDHVSTRIEHSLHVASVAQTIARTLRLNEDLVRAIAVGHDLGHTPFGHMGETCLKEIVKEKCATDFSHELQSLQVVDFVERAYDEHPGLNLTFAVRDGIVCHYGEGFEEELTPDRDKTPGDLAETVRGESRPATLEGCVVRWADKVAYLGRDLEDAIDVVRFVKKADVPASVRNLLGTTNRDIIAKLVTGLCECSNIDEDRIAVCDDVHNALNELYKFNTDHIYKTPQARSNEKQIKLSMGILFDLLLERIQEADGDLAKISIKTDSNDPLSVWNVLRSFLDNDIRQWRKITKHQLVVDFIAGMTDQFFIDCCRQLILPKSAV